MARVLLLTAVAAISAGIWVALLPPAAVNQPIPFDHSKHTEVTCVACHRGAERSARAGIPEVAACLNCHATPPRPVEVVLSAGPALPGSDGRKPTWDELARGARPAWVRVTRLPDHVMFSHRRHVASAKLDCASCHGDMRARRTALTSAPMRLDMTACLSCHTREGATEDCVACHR